MFYNFINIKPPKTYTPVSVNLTFNTQEELNRFTTLMGKWNSPPTGVEGLWRQLKAEGGIHDELASHLTGYCEKC